MLFRSFREERIDPTPLARACLATVIPLVGEKPIEVRFVPPATTGLMCGDPVRVRQILLNLLSNAVKFTDRGSVTLELVWGDDCVNFRVSDTGIGIDPEQFDVLFEEFRQVASGDDRRYGGTGLGLALSRRMARAMGGDIAVTSCVGQQSIFTLTMPAVAPRAPGAAHAA